MASDPFHELNPGDDWQCITPVQQQIHSTKMTLHAISANVCVCVCVHVCVTQ
ncbi:MAG: hypothetical protein ACRC4N_10830 [Gammaproteobacteria bacterium]